MRRGPYTDMVRWRTEPGWRRITFLGGPHHGTTREIVFPEGLDWHWDYDGSNYELKEWRESWACYRHTRDL